jgi:hypothetical protein
VEISDFCLISAILTPTIKCTNPGSTQEERSKLFQNEDKSQRKKESPDQNKKQ